MADTPQHAGGANVAADLAQSNEVPPVDWRRKLSSRLHDQLQQLLYAARLGIEFVESEDSSGSWVAYTRGCLEEAVAEVEALRDLLEHAEGERPVELKQGRPVASLLATAGIAPDLTETNKRRAVEIHAGEQHTVNTGSVTARSGRPADRGVRTRIRCLLVEDHPLVASATCSMLGEAGCTVLGPARSIRDARALIAKLRPDAALVDLILPDGDGATLVELLVNFGIPCAVLSGSAEPSTREGALASVRWVQKPLSRDALRDLVQDLSSVQPNRS